MNASSIPAKAYFALLTVYLIWGTTLGAMRIGVESMPWILLPFLRFLGAGALMLLFCLMRGERLPGLRELAVNAVIGLLLFVGGNTVVCWSVQNITTGLGGLMVATAPFWMIWLSAVFPPREQVKPLAMLGIGVGFVGMIVLLSPQLTHWSGTSPLFWLSIFAMLVNTFSWSLGSIYARKQPTKASLLMGVALQNCFAGLALLPFVLWRVDFATLHFTQSAWISLAYLVLAGNIIALPCYLYTLQTLPVSLSSTFAYVTPVLTVVFGWAFLHETVSRATIIGSAIILSGVILVQWVSRHSSPASIPAAQPTELKGSIAHESSRSSG